MKTVWVLGAGFSKSLGGPLLSQLLSVSSGENLAINYKEELSLLGEPALAVRRLFQLGMKFRDGPIIPSDELLRPGDDIWSDAEEYLEYLDSAAEAFQPATPGCMPPPGRAFVSRIDRLLEKLGYSTPPKIPAMRDTARRIIAADCCSFLHEGNTSGERWDPYHGWARTLTADDTIITFNYDRVLESLESSRIHVTVPGAPDCDGIDKCPVLKLHGSVDWRRNRSGKGYTFERKSISYAVSCDAEHCAIATPGPTKRTASKQWFPQLWELGDSALKKADTVVFIGYSFPPSDAEARSTLLGAICANQRLHLTLNIVLGENPGPNGTRLEQLLRAICLKAGRHTSGRATTTSPELPGTFAVRTHMMRAEDFFTVWSPAILD